MTETVTTETEQNSAPTFDLGQLDETDRLLFDKTQKAIETYNETVKSLKAISGDVNEVADSLKDSADPEISSLRERVEKAQAALKAQQEKFDALVMERAKAQVESATDNEKKAELQTLAEKTLKRIKATQTALVAEYGDDIRSAFASLVNARGGGNATGRGAGVSRPRNFTVKVNGEVATLKNNAGVEVSSFSAAAKVIGCDTKTVQAGYFNSEGTDPEGWTPGKVVKYSITHGDKTYVVEAVKNRDAK